MCIGVCLLVCNLQNICFPSYSDPIVPAGILQGLTGLLGKLTGLFHSLGEWVRNAPSPLEED